MKQPNYPNFSDTTHTSIKSAIDNQFHYQNCSIADKPIVIHKHTQLFQKWLCTNEDYCPLVHIETEMNYGFIWKIK